MFKLLLHFLLVNLAFVSNSFDILETLDMLSPPILKTPRPRQLNLSTTYFSSLENYQVNATPAQESEYRWIARVIHSRSADVPHMCTAVCIDEAIFVTAARCIYTLKVKHTTIIYMSKRFEVRVFVVPSKPTKQMFDDIGIIVVDTKEVKNMKWAKIKLFNVVNRTDDMFQWFGDLNKKGDLKYKVVGYALKKGFHRLQIATRKFDLTELDVVASHDICFKVLEQFRKGNGFRVPCYHSCTHAEFGKRNAKCKHYHGVEGGAVVNAARNMLIGIAIWGSYYPTFELPVGFSIVNSKTFYEDLKCAKRIRKDNGKLATMGYYQRLCDKN